MGNKFWTLQKILLRIRTQQKQENSNRTINIEPRIYIETQNQFHKTPIIIKNNTSQPYFKREIVTHQSRSQKQFNDKTEKEQVKLSEEWTNISEKLNLKFQKWS